MKLTTQRPFIILTLLCVWLISGCTLQANLEAQRTLTAQITVPAAGSPTVTGVSTVTPTETLVPTPTMFTQGTTIAPPVPSQTARPVVSTTVPTQRPQTNPPPTVTPTVRVPAIVHMFHVSPFQQVKAGDPLTVVWEAEGNNARICQVGPGGPTDCTDVPMRGERQFTALNTDKPYSLVLYVNVSTFPNAEQIAVANVYIGCAQRWFFDQPEVALCPRSAPITAQFAAQQFEHGWMIYIEELGAYYGLVDQSVGPGGTKERVLLRAGDPLNIIRDTSAEISAPAGKFAPTSGFGLVWRGDAETFYNWRNLLGWGLALEYGYTGTIQCDDAVQRYQFCYLKMPDSWLAVLHPNVNWYAKSVSYVP